MAYTDEDRRNHIREVQEYLRAISFFDKRIPPIGVDGIFGARTEEAVAAYQRARGLEETGTVGRETWNYLVTEYRIIQNLQAPPRCVSPFPSITYVIRLGDESPVVTILQVMLDEIGKQYPNLPRVPITNVYDEPTIQAVKAFQQASRREITGEVAKGDWDHLADVYNARVSP